MVQISQQHPPNGPKPRGSDTAVTPSLITESSKPSQVVPPAPFETASHTSHSVLSKRFHRFTKFSSVSATAQHAACTAMISATCSRTPLRLHPLSQHITFVLFACALPHSCLFCSSKLHYSVSNLVADSSLLLKSCTFQSVCESCVRLLPPHFILACIWSSSHQSVRL